MRISLVERALVDKVGVNLRVSEDLEQLGLPSTSTPLEGFKDWGVVTHCGVQFYMSSYEPPYVETGDE